MSKPLPPGGVDVSTLSVESLNQVKAQLESELRALGTNVSSLSVARDRFQVSLDAVKAVKSGESTNLLVPLSSSMYASGRIKSDNVTIDLGTGFYAKMPNEEAQGVLQRKIEYIEANMEAFKKQVGDKQHLLRVVTSTLQEKVAAIADGTNR